MARAMLGLGIAIVASGCAGPRLADGVFRSDKGYRVTVPGPDWQIASRTRADLELRHRAEPVGMLVKASCNGVSPRANPKVLARHVLAGLRDRSVVSAEDVPLNGKVAYHAVVDGRSGDEGEVGVRSRSAPGARGERDTVGVRSRSAPGARGERDTRVRVELYVMRDGRCVYDLLYVAPPDSFDAWRPAFARLVESFRTE